MKQTIVRTFILTDDDLRSIIRDGIQARFNLQPPGLKHFTITGTLPAELRVEWTETSTPSPFPPAPKLETTIGF